MAALRIEIKGPVGRISLRTFLGTIRNTFAILAELDSAMSGRPEGTMEWVVSDLSMGSIVVEVQSSLRRSRQPLPDVASGVAASFVKGFDIVEREGMSPPYLSEGGIKKIGSLAALIGRDGARGFTVTDFDTVAHVSERTAINAEQLIPTKRTVVGAIEGRLEMISLHTSPRFVVYQDITHKAVSCRFPRDRFLDLVKDSLDRRVSISGVVHLNAKGEPIRIDMGSSGLRLLGTPSELPTTGELGGSDPEFTGDMSTEEFIRTIRG